MPIEESDVRKIIAEVEATSRRLRECIRVRELASTHRLGRMRRLRMLGQQKAYKREAGFDRIETIAEMCERHFIADFHSETLYTKLYNPKWPHTPEEHTVEMRVDVDRLRMENFISQPAPPPQCDSSPRRSPAIGTRSDEPGGSRAESQSTEREESFPLQASVDGFLHVVSCISPEQECILLQPTTSQQTAARETIEEAAAAKDDSMVYRAKQAAWPRWLS